MNSFAPNYLEKIVDPQRLIAMVRQIGEHKGKQELYKQQAPEMLENLRRVALIESTESSNRLEGMVANFTVADLVRACPMVSQDMIRHILSKLRKEGRIEPVSLGRFAKWRKTTR